MTKNRGQLAAAAETALKKMVRESLDAAVNNTPYQPTDPGLPDLEKKCGCFVTLKTAGRLRGCLGCFSSDDPIWKTAPEYAAHSALRDPRFGANRLTPDELPEVDISISVLSALERCAHPEAITLGIHGIYVREGGRSGCFLPSVARETGWNLEEFWGHCCRDKAGLAWDAWKDPDTDLYTFTVTEIEEKAG